MKMFLAGRETRDALVSASANGMRMRMQENGVQDRPVEVSTQEFQHVYETMHL